MIARSDKTTTPSTNINTTTCLSFVTLQGNIYDESV